MRLENYAAMPVSMELYIDCNRKAGDEKQTI